MNTKITKEKFLLNALKNFKQSISNQDWNNSIDICEQIISICSEKLLKSAPEKIQPEKYTILGDFLLNKGQVGGALACYDYATNLKNQIANHYEKLGREYLEKSNFPLAFDYFNKALENDSKSPELYGNLGTLYVNIKQYEQAIAHYQQAIKLNPKLTAVYRNLSRLYNQIGNKKEANDYWYQGFIVEHKLDKASKSYKLGNKFLTNNKLDQAILCYHRTLELNKNYKFNFEEIKQNLSVNEIQEKAFNLFQKLGLIFYQNKQYKQAIESYKIAIKLSKKLGNVSKTLITEYQKIIENYPEASANDYFDLAKLLRTQGNFDAAIDTFIKIIKLFPNFNSTYIYLQYTKINNNQREKIITVYRDLLEKQSKNNLVWGNLGDMLTVNGNLEEAINCYQKSAYFKAIKKNPDLEKLTWPPQKQKIPDFLIIGAPKCGTSSLYKYIGEHPQVFLPHKKELDFFSRCYNHGLEWYLAQFPTITDNAEYITGEATPRYLNYTDAASKVHDLCPEIKLIVLLRNPVEQIISYYYHMVNRGSYQKSLEEAIKEKLKPIYNLSEEQIIKLFIPNQFTLMNCLYYYHLKRWLHFFPREQFLIIKSEDFFENTRQIVQKVYQFLGLTEYQLTNYPKANVGDYPSISDDIKKYLSDYCRPHNKKLEYLLGRQFNWD